MQTVKDIDKTFRAIVANHLTIQSFYTNTTKELDIDKLTIDKYPLLYAGCSGAQINGGFVEFRYEVIIGDLVVEEQSDDLVDVYSETLLLMQDVIAKFEHALSTIAADVVSHEWAFELPVDCQPYTSRFDNLLTGWTANFTIRIPNVVDLCDAIYK